MAPFKIATVNCLGWAKKRPHLEHLLDSEQVQILALSETLLKPTANPKLPRFSVHHVSQTSGKGGVALAYSKTLNALPFEIPSEFSSIQACGITLQTPHGPVFIFSIYLPVHSGFPQSFFHYLLSLGKVIVMGDFNARHENFGDHDSNTKGRALADFLDQSDYFRIQNTSPTFINSRGSSIIDHILISTPLIQYFDHQGEIGDTPVSDHLPLIAFCDILDCDTNASTKKVINNWSATDWTAFSNHVERNLPPPPTYVPNTIDSTVTDLTNCIQTAIKLAVPTTLFDSKKPPLPSHIISLIKEKRRIYRNFTKTRDPTLKTIWNRLNENIRRLITQHKERQWSKTCSKLDFRDGSKFWHKFKILTGQKTSQPSPIVVNEHIFNTNQEKAEAFANSLADVFQQPQGVPFSDSRILRINQYILNDSRTKPTPTLPPAQENPHPLLADISTDEILSALSQGKNTAPGNDRISRNTLKRLPPSAINLLRGIFNICLGTGYYPTPWKESVIIMIPKPHKDRKSVNSYRPISLLNVMGKLFEKILKNRLEIHLFEHNLIPPTQFGFRPKHSAHHPILKLLNETTSAINQGKCCLALFLDIERAFDKVWHNGLIFKLLHANIPINFTRIISGYLNSRSAKIRVGTATSAPFKISAGVPQGSILAPLLFNFYVHDIPQPLAHDVSLTQYADDTAYWVSAKTTHIAFTSLQTQINLMTEWMNNWLIKPNPKKSQLVLFHSGSLTKSQNFNRSHIGIKINNTPVPLSTQATYLGINLHQYLNWTPEIKLISKRVSTRMNLIKSLKGRPAGCSSSTLLHTYKTFIRPLYDYRFACFTQLSDNQLHRILQQERRCLRVCLYLHSQYASEEVHPLANIEPINDRILSIQKKFTQRSLQSNVTSHRNIFLNIHLPLRKKPKKKLTLPTARLLNITEHLDEELQDILDRIPSAIR